MPNCVPPSDGKVDIKWLKDDISNFFSSRHFEQSHVDWWDNFLGDKDSVFARPDVATHWLLDDILLMKGRQQNQDQPAVETNAESLDVLQIPRPSNAEPEVEKLIVQQSSDDIPQVWDRNITFSFFFLIFSSFLPHHTLSFVLCFPLVLISSILMMSSAR